MLLKNAATRSVFVAASAAAAASAASFPVVINTWFANANNRTFSMLQAGYTALDSVEIGCTLCEDEQCDGTVGYGGSVDADGDVSLDALIMDAETHDVGAVTNLRNVRHAISAARKVLHYSTHTLLSGDGGEEPNIPQAIATVHHPFRSSCSRELQSHGAHCATSSIAGGQAAATWLPLLCPPLLRWASPRSPPTPQKAPLHVRPERGRMGSRTHEMAAPAPPPCRRRLAIQGLPAQLLRQCLRRQLVLPALRPHPHGDIHACALPLSFASCCRCRVEPRPAPPPARPPRGLPL